MTSSYSLLGFFKGFQGHLRVSLPTPEIPHVENLPVFPLRAFNSARKLMNLGGIVKNNPILAHPQFSPARIARRGGRWMRNPGGKGFCREPRRLSAKEGGVEGLPQNLG
jgi:hypothetical protein